MADEMLKKLREIRTQWLARGVSKTLNARMGIHIYLYSREFWFSRSPDYTVIGNGVNLASRLESSSEANKILISEDTYLLVKDEFDTKEKDTITVKGFSYPVKTFEVIGRKENSAEVNLPLHKEIPGFSLSYNPSELSDNETAIKLISDVDAVEKQKINKFKIENIF